MKIFFRPFPVLAVAACLAFVGCTGPERMAYEPAPIMPGSQVAIGGATGSPGQSSVLSPARFSLGDRDFARGDEIVIHEVLTSSPRPRIGDTVLVRGAYRLASADSAMLALFMTTRGPSGRTRSLPSQMQQVVYGTGEFELSTVLSDTGDLHVSFYPSRGGSVMGGVYFYPKGM